MIKADETIKMSVEEIEALLERKKKEARQAEQTKRDAYEGIKAEMVHAVMHMVKKVTADVEALHDYVRDETDAFKDVMREYGKLVRENQMSYRITEGDHRIEIASNKVKRFDERADIAAARLIEFMKKWIDTAPGGDDNPMYQLAMVLLERNRDNELDYKNISKLYTLEARFDEPEYSEIMQLFKESHLVESNATRYYFYERNKDGVWHRIEPSFNKM